jgi:hypothetical protein
VAEPGLLSDGITIFFGGDLFLVSHASAVTVEIFDIERVGGGGGRGPRFFVFFVSFVAALVPLRDAAARRSRTGSEVDARRAQTVAAALDPFLDDADLP